MICAPSPLETHTFLQGLGNFQQHTLEFLSTRGFKVSWFDRASIGLLPHGVAFWSNHSSTEFSASPAISLFLVCKDKDALGEASGAFL